MKTRKGILRMGTKTGAALGGVIFLIFGLMPGFNFGSYQSLVALKHLMGGPVEPTVPVRMVMAMGIVLGISFIASVSIVAGAIVGTVVGYITGVTVVPAEGKEPLEDAVKAE